MTLELLYLLPAVIAFAWVVIINLKKKALSFHRWSSLLVMSLGFVLLFNLFYFFEQTKDSLWVDIGFDVAVSFFVTFNYLTMRDLTGVRGVRARDCLMFLYPITIFILLFIFYKKATPQEINEYMAVVRIDDGDMNFSPLVNYASWVNIIFCCSATIILIIICKWSIKRTRWYIQMLEEYYVNIRRKAGDRVRALITLNIVSIIIISILVWFPLSYSYPAWACIIAPLVFSVYAFSAGWCFNRIYYSTCELKRKLLNSTPEGNIDSIVNELHIAMGRRPEPDHVELLPEKTFNRIQEEDIYLIYHCTLRRVARKLEVSRYMLTRSIHHYSGLTFSAYIRSLRIAKAVDLLESVKGNNRMTVEEIASACGYSDAEIFSQDLADTTGMSPQMYLGEALAQ